MSDAVSSLPEISESARAGSAASVRLGETISPQARRHLELRRKIARQNPAVLELIGPDVRTIYAGALLFCLHWSAIWFFSRTSVLVLFLGALFFGQFVLHAAGTLAHESAHRLVVRDRYGKLAFDLLLETILMSFSKQLTYQHNHISTHHPYLGEYEHDYEHDDLCRILARKSFKQSRPRAQRLMTGLELAIQLLPLGFIVAEVVFPRFYRRKASTAAKDSSRPLHATRPQTAERVLFVAWSLAMHGIVFWCFGVLGWLYHIWSWSLFLSKWGFTAVGQARSEHPDEDRRSASRSTYWWGNKLLFNTGYHFEHHTFPTVAWSRLPELSRRAPELSMARNEKTYLQFWWEFVKSDFSKPMRHADAYSIGDERCRI